MRSFCQSVILILYKDISWPVAVLFSMMMMMVIKMMKIKIIQNYCSVSLTGGVVNQYLIWINSDEQDWRRKSNPMKCCCPTLNASDPPLAMSRNNGKEKILLFQDIDDELKHKNMKMTFVTIQEDIKRDSHVLALQLSRQLMGQQLKTCSSLIMISNDANLRKEWKYVQLKKKNIFCSFVV